MLSNLVVRGLDERLSTLANERKLVYTRYADDLVFSTDSRSFSRSDAEAWVRTVYGELQKHALRPRTAKTVIAPPGARKIVLGLLVDCATPRLPREFRERLELHIYHLRKRGVAAHAVQRGFRTLAGMHSHIRGLLIYAMQVDARFAQPLVQDFDEIAWASGDAARGQATIQLELGDYVEDSVREQQNEIAAKQMDATQ